MWVLHVEIKYLTTISIFIIGVNFANSKPLQTWLSGSKVAFENP
jgi:hypothetical protein